MLKVNTGSAEGTIRLSSTRQPLGTQPECNLTKHTSLIIKAPLFKNREWTMTNYGNPFMILLAGSICLTNQFTNMKATFLFSLFSPYHRISPWNLLNPFPIAFTLSQLSLHCLFLLYINSFLTLFPFQVSFFPWKAHGRKYWEAQRKLVPSSSDSSKQLAQRSVIDARTHTHATRRHT